MPWIIVDVESDGPCPGLYSMVSLGAVKLDRDLKTTFYGQTAPLMNARFDPEALAISHTTREEHMSYPRAEVTMLAFRDWLTSVCPQGDKLVFVSDNPAFDWAWVNYYCHLFLGKNPMGFSARRIGDMYSGLVKDAGKSNEWKRLRRTSHTHNPVDDAKGNAEALLAMVDMGLKIPGVV